MMRWYTVLTLGTVVFALQGMEKAISLPVESDDPEQGGVILSEASSSSSSEFDVELGLIRLSDLTDGEKRALEIQQAIFDHHRSLSSEGDEDQESSPIPIREIVHAHHNYGVSIPNFYLNIPVWTRIMNDRSWMARGADCMFCAACGASIVVAIVLATG